MKISTRSRYGLRFLVELARRDVGRPMFLSEIARNQKISEKYLSKLVISLRGAGLIRSVRGPHGGYVLARPPGKISLLEIVDALEGEQYILKCLDDHGTCPASRTCVARETWGGLEKVMCDYCKSLSLAEIVRKGPPLETRGSVVPFRRERKSVT